MVGLSLKSIKLCAKPILLRIKRMVMAMYLMMVDLKTVLEHVGGLMAIVFYCRHRIAETDRRSGQVGLHQEPDGITAGKVFHIGPRLAVRIVPVIISLVIRIGHAE